MTRPRWPARRRATRALPAVVDASMAVQWFAREAGSDTAAELLEGEDILAAPDVMPIEAANAWWKKVRRREMTAGDLNEALVNLMAVEMEWVSAGRLLVQAATLAVQIDHPVYDCLHLVLATTRRTADERLRAAAAGLGVPVWRP